MESRDDWRSKELLFSSTINKNIVRRKNVMNVALIIKEEALSFNYVSIENPNLLRARNLIGWSN